MKISQNIFDLDRSLTKA